MKLSPSRPAQILESSRVLRNGSWKATQQRLSASPTNSFSRPATYEAALRVFTEHECPQQWAEVQNNIGEAWRKLPGGDRAAKMTKSIAYFQAALRVSTEAGFPREHGIVARNLSSARTTLADTQEGAATAT